MTTQPIPKTSWREAALNEALHAESLSGEGSDALLRAIRRHDGNDAPAATLSVYLEKSQLTRFWEAQNCGARSIIQKPAFYSDADDECISYVDWLAFEWREEKLEAAFSPSNGDWVTAILLAQNEAILRELTRELGEFALRPAGRSLRYSGYWKSAPQLDEQIGKVMWDDIVLPPALMQEVREAVEGFFTHRAAYEALGFAWRRGVLLVGPPGTGKTMLCKAIAAAIPDWPFLYVRDLKERNEREAIATIWKRARALAPCILAFEDIDGLVNDHNRTVFLNEMDGFERNDGIFVVASSNHPGKIDEALLKRPSRFDRVFHIGLPKTPERAEFCRRLLARPQMAEHLAPDFDAETLAQTAGERSDGFTPAYLKEAFTAAALQQAQSGALILDSAFGEAVLAQIKELKGHLKRSRMPDAMSEFASDGEPIGLRR